MSAPPVIADLVERFDQQGDAYKYLRRQIDATDAQIDRVGLRALRIDAGRNQNRGKRGRLSKFAVPRSTGTSAMHLPDCVARFPSPGRRD